MNPYCIESIKLKDNSVMGTFEDLMMAFDMGSPTGITQSGVTDRDDFVVF